MQLVRSNTAEGREIIAHAEGRIAALYKQLAAPMLGERETDQIRGRILELQKLIEFVHNGEQG